MIIVSVLISLLFLAAYYGLCAAAFIAGGAKAMLKSIWQDKKSVFAVLFILLLSTAGISFLIFQNRFVYYWDYSGYWKISIGQTDLLFTAPGEALAQLVNSIAESDYNRLLPTIAALPQRITAAVLGGSFQQYVITNHLVFMLPAMLGQGLCAVKLFSRLFPAGTPASAGRRFAAAVLIAALMPAAYYPILLGFIDAGILLPMSAAVYLLLDYDLTAPFTLRSQWRDLFFVLALLLAWLSRRYAAYFVVGVAVAMVFLGAIQLWAGKKASTPPVSGSAKKGRAAAAAPGAHRLRNVLCHLAYMGAVGGVILLLFFRSFFLNALLTDYSAAYSAYDAQFISKLTAIGGSYGLLALLAAVITVVVFCLIKKRGRGAVAALLVMTAVSTLSFFTVQSMGYHHRYIILIPLYLFTAAAIFPLFRTAVSAPFRAAAALCCLALAANLSYAFLPPVRTVLAPARAVLCDAYTPLQRSDIDELYALRDHLLEETPGEDDWVYVLASSGILNDDIIRCLDLPDSLLALPSLLLSSHVDLRDGFPISFLAANVVVTTDPIQTHLPEGTQEVVRFLAQQVQDSDSSIGAHFQREERTFSLDGGVTVYIYDLVTPWTLGDLQYLQAYFSGLYPDYPALFADRLTVS